MCFLLQVFGIIFTICQGKIMDSFNTLAGNLFLCAFLLIGTFITGADRSVLIYLTSCSSLIQCWVYTWGIVKLLCIFYSGPMNCSCFKMFWFLVLLGKHSIKIHAAWVTLWKLRCPLKFQLMYELLNTQKKNTGLSKYRISYKILQGTNTEPDLCR